MTGHLGQLCASARAEAFCLQDAPHSRLGRSSLYSQGWAASTPKVQTLTLVKQNAKKKLPSLPPSKMNYAISMSTLPEADGLQLEPMQTQRQVELCRSCFRAWTVHMFVQAQTQHQAMHLLANIPQAFTTTGTDKHLHARMCRP